MRMCLAFTGFFLLVSILSQVNGGKLLASGSEKPPTLSEAIQLLQLDTFKQLKKTIKEMEEQNEKLERRIQIVEEEKEENLNQMEQQKTQIKEDLEGKILGMEIEMTQIKEELKKKLYEAQTKCQREKNEPCQEHTEALIESKNALLESQSLVEYMSDIILHSHKMMEEREKLIETQEIAIKEINKKSKTYEKITAKQLAANEKALQTISLQEENIDLLKSSLTTAQILSKLSTNDLDNISVAPFMVELMESYNKQTTMVENLRIVLEQDKEIETHISEILSEIANTSLTTNLINSNWDTIEQQAKMIQMQSKSISLLRPLLGSNPNKTDILWFNKAEDGATLEASSCGCLPRATQPTSLMPAWIEYLCEGEGNRSYSLECESGVCGTQEFPSCDETVLWENETLLWDNCKEVNFNGVTHLCGEGSMEERNTKTIGAGLMKEVVRTPCGDCGDLSTDLVWQPWGSCVNEDGNVDRPDMQCRKRGNAKIGFQEEERENSCVAPWTQLSTGCYRFNEQEMNWTEAQEFCLSIQASLVEIDSDEESRAIQQEFKKQGYSGAFWQGLTDRNSEGDWRLESTGKSPVYTNWRENEPNNIGNEDCATIHVHSKWNDRVCSRILNSLCETL